MHANAAASERNTMRSLWQGAGLQAIEMREIRIPVVYTSFDDFCQSNIVPIGPSGHLISAMSADEKDALKASLPPHAATRAML